MAEVVDLESVRGRRGALSPAAIASAQKERAAISLREQGLSFDEIARQLGFHDRSGARKAVERGLSRWLRETDEGLRARELARIEMLVDRLWPLIDRDEPDWKAFDRYMKLVEYRAKITGLFAKPRSVPETYPCTPAPTGPDKAALTARFIELTDGLYVSMVEGGYVGNVDVAYDDDEDGDRRDREWVTLDASGTGVGAGDTDDNDEEDDEPVPPGRWVDGRRVLDEEPDVDDAQRARAQAEEDRRVREAVERAFDIDR